MGPKKSWAGRQNRKEETERGNFQKDREG